MSSPQSQIATSMFSEQIENVFGDFINDGRIQCTKDEFKKNLESLLKIAKRQTL